MKRLIKAFVILVIGFASLNVPNAHARKCPEGYVGRLGTGGNIDKLDKDYCYKAHKAFCPEGYEQKTNIVVTDRCVSSKGKKVKVTCKDGFVLKDQVFFVGKFRGVCLDPNDKVKEKGLFE